MRRTPVLIIPVAILLIALIWGEALAQDPSSPALGSPTPDGVPLTADASGLSMTVTLDRDVVEPDGSVVASVAVHNGRSVPAVLAGGCPVAMHGQIPVPQEPVGRTWDGIEGRLKQYLLTRGDGPGGVPALQPVRIDAVPTDCEVDAGDRTLEAGETLTTALTWTASITDGVPAAPGTIPFEVSLAYEPSGAPPSRAPDATGLIASWIKSVEQLVIAGSLDVVGTPPTTVSAGQAFDALLADHRFRRWLSERPRRTWSQGNLFLVSTEVAEGIVPAGASWEIDLFRERGVPREFAIGFVDASTGVLRSISYCDAPSDR